MSAAPIEARPYGDPGSTFIQWKGTAVCMDLICLCGEGHHVDATFAYAVKCAACGRTLVLGTAVTVREARDDEDYPHALTGTSDTERDAIEKGTDQ